VRKFKVFGYLYAMRIRLSLLACLLISFAAAGQTRNSLEPKPALLRLIDGNLRQAPINIRY